MKKLVAYIASWILFWIGDLISKPMNYFNWDWLYPIYNCLMLSSHLVQIWANNNKPWEKK
jgi:hypothetical protein